MLSRRYPEPLIPINVEVIKDGLVVGLAPIEDLTCQLLILGTMPSVESLKQQAYYANSRNFFWKLIEEVTADTMPESYEDKKRYLIKNKIALWDMCQSCIRKGSLDSNISEVLPNDIKAFVSAHPCIKVIAFNGKESALLFRKHIVGLENVTLLSLPSTSPANAGVSWDRKVVEWNKLKEFIQ